MISGRPGIKMLRNERISRVGRDTRGLYPNGTYLIFFGYPFFRMLARALERSWVSNQPQRARDQPQPIQPRQAPNWPQANQPRQAPDRPQATQPQHRKRQDERDAQ